MSYDIIPTVHRSRSQYAEKEVVYYPLYVYITNVTSKTGIDGFQTPKILIKH